MSKTKKKTNGKKHKSGEKKFKNLRKVLGMAETVETEHMIALKMSEGGLAPIVYCTCNWVFGPSENLISLGLAAKKHENETGHKRREH